MKIHGHDLSIADLQPETRRSPGLHFSDVLKRILQGQDPGRFRGGPIDPEFVFAGFLWEEALSNALGRLARKANADIEQLEVSFDGIWLTIDNFDTQRWKVREFKFTESSSSRPITDHHFWHYFVQLKAYCLATETKEAELWVYFARGNYKDKRREARRYDVKFSASELAENWRMIDNTRKQMLKEGWVA